MRILADVMCKFRKILISLLLLLAVSCVMAQGRVDSVALRAMQVGRVMQQERVYLHFDNTAYYIGETMWFKAYVSFGADNRPSTLSKVLYVELVAPEGYVVETKKYRLDDKGCCHGDFELKPLLLSGYYEIRAYTRYMLNWDKSAVFSRVFPVFDKVNADNWDFRNMLDRRRAFLQNGKWVSHELPDATLAFYPEGGHLVAGLESRVAFELRVDDGLFGEEQITLLKDDKTLLETQPVHMGKGVFTITPELGATYSAEVVARDKNGNSKRHRFDLPPVAEEGVVMRVNELPDSVEVIMSNTLKETTELGFVVLHRGTMGFYRKFTSDMPSVRFAFAKSQLPEGVNRVVLFVDEGLPLAERQFFIQHETLHGRTQESVKLRLLANGYHLVNTPTSPNEKITLKVVRDDGKPISRNADLSLSVSDAQGRQVTSYSHDIYTYMLLGSELKGYIPDASQYFDSNNVNRKEHLDLVMLTHGWTSYDWQKLARRKIEEMQPIERGITIKGRFFQKRLDTRLGHRGESVLTPQAYNLVRLDYAADSGKVKMTTFRTDSVGEFVLELEDFYGTRVASLNPSTLFKHSKNISYQFALDRYYSPDFRLYDYWERHLGQPMSRSESDSLVRLNPFEYMLSSVEVVAKKNKEICGRPPHSEMRFNYLDEWEYAQDVTYLKMFDRYRDALYEAVRSDAISNERTQGASVKWLVNDKMYSAVETETDIVTLVSDNPESRLDKYVGHIRYVSGVSDEVNRMPVDHEFDHVLTAEDVVRSAIQRHGYHWAYWVQLMVVDGEYSSLEVPKPDMFYLRGVPNAEKMTAFKEFVIRSDEKTRLQFENRDNYWSPLTFMLDNKTPQRKFYMGFLSHMYVLPGSDMPDAPNVYAFENVLTNGKGVYYPLNPNYVACMIPYTDEEHGEGIVPEYAATGSSMRYTAVQGYSDSKQFYSPDYSRMTPQADDYRRTLLWIPHVEINDSGEAVIEFYNSSVCKDLVASVEGRDGTALFSSSDVVATRIGVERDSVKGGKVMEKFTPKVVNVPVDSVLEAQCAAEYDKGMIYYNQKRYKNAIMIFAELLQYKYPPAFYMISRCYSDGTGLACNEELAMKFLQEAAKYNEPRAQYELYEAMCDGKGVECDITGALEWLELSSANGEPHAMFELSRRCNEGDGVVQDTLRARELLEKAALQKHPRAMCMHGKRLESESLDGIGFIRDAAASNDEEALLYMLDYEHNAENYKAAFKCAKQLHMSGNYEGTKRMADYYLEGKGVKRDKRLARDLYRDAAVAGNKEAAAALRNL